MTAEELIRRQDILHKYLGFIVLEWLTEMQDSQRRGFYRVRISLAVRNTGWSRKHIDNAIKDGVIYETQKHQTKYLHMTEFGIELFKPLLTLYGRYDLSETVWTSEKI